MAAIVIKTGSERENCYRFCRILVDIGNKIARGYVERVITYNFGYKDINEFFNINENLIREFPDKYGYYNQGKFIKNNYLDGVIRAQFNKTLDHFDVGACTSLIQNILASNSKYVDHFDKHPNPFYLNFDKNDSLYKLREMRNEHFGHIFVFKMGHSDFAKAISDLDGIFYDLNNNNYSFRTEINNVMRETVMEDKMQEYLKIILEDFIADRNLIKDFLDVLQDKINEDRDNFQTIKDLISEIDLDEIKDSLETKIINLSNEIKANEEACQMIISDGFKQNLKDLFEK